MEDGDDDTSVAIARQKLEEDDGSSEKDTLVSKNENKELSSGDDCNLVLYSDEDESKELSSEELNVSSTSQSDENTFVASTQFDNAFVVSAPSDSKVSSSQGENKCISGPSESDVSDAIEFVDGNELPQVAGESSPAPGNETPSLSEEVNRTVPQDDFSETNEDQNEKLCYDKANRIPSLEQSGNEHSSLRTEEEGEEEAMEEEEEGEQEHQTIASSKEPASSPEGFSQHVDEYCKKSGNEYKECNNDLDKNINELLIGTGLQKEINPDDKDFQDESNFERKRDICPEKGDKNENVENINEIGVEKDHIEYFSTEEKGIVRVDCTQETNDQKTISDYISTEVTEKDMLDELKASDVQGVTEETCENETEDVVFQTNVDKENKQAKCEKMHEFDNFVPEMVQNTSISNDQSTTHCSNNIMLDNEKMETESGQFEEYCIKQDINVIESNLGSKKIDVLDDTCSNMETHSEIRLTEQSIETSTENIPCDTNFEDSDMHEIGREIQSSDSDSDSGREYEEEICSPQTIQDKKHENHECNESKRNDISCIKEPKGLEKVENSDIPLKVNGEVELTKASLLNNKDSNASTKDKVSLKRKLEASPSQDISSDISVSESVKGNIQFKGFKKRYIAQVSEVSSKDSSDILSPVQDELRLKSKRSAKKLVLETSQVLVSHQPLPDGAQTNTPLTEYAQYLGLQPTVKFKCYNCGESGFPSMSQLQDHQNTCLKNIRIHSYNKPPPSPIIEPAPSTNFRITRKVYLCSACGTYYENWNLFLHMREVHNRHICLFCLLMFSQADKLAQHLSGKHGIADSLYSSPEQFLDEFKGSFFLTCCTCEQMFSEGDDFCDHMCKDTSVMSTDQACSLCGLKGAHFPTCRRAFTDSNSLISPSQSNSQNIVANSSSDTSQNAQLGMQEKPIVASKYLMQNEKATSGRKSLHKLPEQNVERSDKSHHSGDDDYDISDAASYCHVNIHEPDKQKVENLEGKIINKGTSIDENDLQKIDDVPSRVESSSLSLVSKEIAEDNDNENKVENNTKSNGISQNESQEHVEKLSQHTEVTAEENTEMEASEKSEFPSSLSSSNNEAKKNEVQLINMPKSPKVGEYSESDSSGSGGDSHESEGSSSSSDVSSDENEQGEKEPEKVLKSEDSDMEKSDSDKMSIVVDEGRSEDEVGKQVNANDNRNNSNITENEANEISEEKSVSPIDSDFKMSDKPFNNNDVAEELQDNIQIAGDDVPLLELTLEENLDALPIQTIVKECVKISCSTCVYCNHAKKIAVNGKQLVLHLLAEHRFEPVVCSDSGELTPIFGFVENLKAKLSQLQNMFFNTDSYDSGDKNFTRSYDRTYECFHCHFITTLHKELYVHNRKMHQKTILLCIMCKSNFYSYSELLCHLCPGIYVPDSNILFRCCLCVVDGLPSAFRLMVHLRKRHHACDVCLETTGDQQKLSNHVWKHKLHHLCYRCGIAYRNKPDITKHLFWKHGTESVLCKKCLQKKWPHVYHFCIPPTAFLCEECNASFSRAVALKVHKRLHTGDVSYQCEECEEKFISKKLLKRHKEKHKVIEQTNNEKIMEQETQDFEPCEMKSCSPVREYHETNKDVKEEVSDGTKSNVLAEKFISSQVPQEIPKEQDEAESNSVSEDTKHSKKSKVVDVYDLPPLNLSSESDESDNEQSNNQLSKDIDLEDSAKTNVSECPNEGVKIQDKELTTEEEVQPVQIVDGVWDNFKTYKANLEKREILQAQATGSLKPSFGDENNAIVDVVMADHDYCVLSEKPPDENNSHPAGITSQTQSHCDAVAAKEATVNLDDKGSGFGADHNYCFNTSPHSEDKKDQPDLSPHVPSTLPQEVPPVPSSHSSLPSIPVPPPLPPSTPPIPVALSPKKKQKSPKKKQKQSGSSSSSDSSSNSDSSSCTCGTNCSCSSSSSSSSGSSSTSSDSDSSSSEGRRRQAARRERRRERAKRKTETESKSGTPPPVGMSSTSGAELGGIRGTTMEATLTRLQIDSSGAGSLQIDDTPLIAGPEPEDHEFLICESDLDTTETETDEDFYDKYPQKQANKLLAEKRNQLLLLAAVAPVNNGTIAQPSPPPPPETPEPVQKKKVKTKRHKKSQHNNSEKKVESKLKLNIPAAYYNSSFSVGNARHPVSPLSNSQNLLSSHASRLPLDTFSPVNPEATTPVTYHSTGSGSETDSKRLSKRKRIPKKFYGDSSDEEAEHTPHQAYKWRKVTPANSGNSQIQSTVSSGFGYRGVTSNVPPPEPVLIQTLPPPDKSDDDEEEEEEEGGADGGGGGLGDDGGDGDESDSGHEDKRSSSDSSNSDSDNEQSDADSDVETTTTVTNVVSTVSGNASQQKNENLYCYCQCPYDEVSEMIACDGKDCSIEWFHFECVGIMVPPKGKWFCPDCRKKTAARSEYLLHA